MGINFYVLREVPHLILEKCKALTDRDFKNKATISLKELKESRMNMKILSKINYGDDTMRTKLLNETEQLIKIIATIIKNKS
jgi:four helix bundle protein